MDSFFFQSGFSVNHLERLLFPRAGDSQTKTKSLSMNESEKSPWALPFFPAGLAWEAFV